MARIHAQAVFGCQIMACRNMLDMHVHVMHILIMTFDEFLKANEISNAEAARHLDRDATLIGRYRARTVTPSPEIMARIFEWSKGEVPPTDMLACPKMEAVE